MGSPKTIPQLQEVTDINDNAYFVVDTGSVTKKISKANLKKNLVEALRTVSANVALASTDDTVLINTTSAGLPVDLIATLPAVANVVAGKKITLKNIGLGTILVNPTGSGVKIYDSSSEDSFTLDRVGQSNSFVWDGSNWYVTA